jgi:hypothetical protein
MVMNCKVEVEGSGENQRIYLHRDGEDYPRFYPDNFKINIWLDEKRVIEYIITSMANLYFNGKLSMKDLEELYETKNYIYYSNLISILQDIESGLSTFNDYRKTITENTTYAGRCIFKNYENIFIFSKDFEKAISLDGAVLYDNAFISLPQYLGNRPYTISFWDKDICIYIAKQVINGNFDIIEDIFDILKLGINNIEELIKKKYIYKEDIKKEFDKVIKRNEYYDRLSTVRRNLWSEGIYKIGDDGYIIKPEYDIPFFINREEIPKVWQMDTPTASRMIVKGKFKVYSSMDTIYDFMQYWKMLTDDTKKSVLRCLGKIKDDAYDFLLSYLSTS